MRIGWSGPLIACTVLPVLAGCSSTKVSQWTEDVQLSTGTALVVTRSSEYRAISEIDSGGGAAWLLVKSTIKADLPSPIRQTAYFEGLLIPIVFDVVVPGNVVYLVGVPTAVGTDYWKVPPHELYVAFALSEAGWARVPLEGLPDSLRPNLLVNVRELFINQGARSGTHVSKELKQKLDSDPRIGRRFKTILRLPDRAPEKAVTP